MANWEDLLKKPAEDAVRPAVLPTGTYVLQVQSHRFDESSKKKTPFVEFVFKALDAGDDVDREKLAEIKLSEQKITADFYLTDRSDFMLTDFLSALGLEIGGGRTFGDLIPEATGRTVRCYFVHEPIPDSDRFKAVPKKWLPAETA